MCVVKTYVIFKPHMLIPAHLLSKNMCAIGLEGKTMSRNGSHPRIVSGFYPASNALSESIDCQWNDSFQSMDFSENF